MIPCIAPLVLHTAPTVFPVSFSVDDTSRYYQQQKVRRCDSSNGDSNGGGEIQQRSRRTTGRQPDRRGDVNTSRLRSAAWVSVVPCHQEQQQQQQQQDDDSGSDLHLLLDTLVDHMLCCASSRSSEEDYEGDESARHANRRHRHRAPGVRPSHSLDVVE
jgi:hypothetical protein